MANIKWMAIFALAAIVASEVNADNFICPEMEVMTDFVPEKFTGLWFEQTKYPFAFEVIFRCITAKYSMNADGTMSIVNRGYNIVKNRWDEMNASAKVVAPGKLLMTVNAKFIKKPMNFWILGTDYASYAVVYHCNEDFKFIKGQTVWVLTREQIPPKDVLEKAYKVLDDHNLPRDLLQKTHQETCPKPSLF